MISIYMLDIVVQCISGDYHLKQSSIRYLFRQVEAVLAELDGWPFNHLQTPVYGQLVFADNEITQAIRQTDVTAAASEVSSYVVKFEKSYRGLNVN